MNVKIRNEIQALIRIQERNNNGGELREFICARKVDDCGEKTYLIAFDHYSICARYCGESISRAIAFGGAFNVDLWEYVMDREYICASDPEAREMWQRIWRDYRLMAKGWALLLFLACPESGSVIAAAYSGITARASAVLNGD